MPKPGCCYVECFNDATARWVLTDLGGGVRWASAVCDEHNAQFGVRIERQSLNDAGDLASFTSWVHGPETQ